MAPTPRCYHYSSTLDSGSVRLLSFLASSVSSDSSSLSSTSDSSGTASDLPLAHEPCRRSQGGGSIDTLLHLTITEYRIGSEPSYRALSYTWGPATDDQGYNANTNINVNIKADNNGGIVLGQTFVILNGAEHDVTPNLLDALRQCAISFPSSLFWVDALCINQTDLIERQVHVALMDQIYRNAHQVILWLGHAPSESPQVLQLMHKIAGLDAETLELATSFDHPREFASIEPTIGGASAHLWTQLLSFYERRWFHRGWVIQEVALARDAQGLWGTSAVPWDIMVGGSRLLLKERLRKNFFATLSSRISVSELAALPLGRNVWRIKLIRDACMVPDYSYLLVVGLCTGSYSLDSAEHILVHLMRMSRDFEWTDMRDRIYSTLGLVAYTARQRQVSPLSIKPDYAAHVTPAQVLTQMAVSVIERSNYLGIIAQVSDPSFRTISDLASWVPDFNRMFNYPMGHTSPINVCGVIRSPDLSFRFRGRCLHAQGIRVGVIKSQTNIPILQETSQFDMLDMLNVAFGSVWPVGVDRIDVLWRTMIWDIMGVDSGPDVHPAPDQLGDSFAKWLLTIFDVDKTKGIEPVTVAGPGDPIKYLLPYCRSCIDHIKASSLDDVPTTVKIAMALNGERGSMETVMAADVGLFLSLASGSTWMQQLFVTDTGYLGMGPRSGRLGDEVWIINGCPFPMVLTPHKLRYKTVGRSYLHGIMHGEAVKHGVQWQEVVVE
ncbi:hypothetical protein S7711_06274 [Stachybotrys chartarum IBT 7711]|uniref:Heterokaryon incompatibility domain-containing protein n=1 Tax=Stachybotrys chartarum (strain CBS 109288 / IBT 7711) TaxID=1280523 RepID=A0A084B511_STACB|nr:hypothetical protein S7711_06274 [Stachybotrys chartarum IBT 7711]